MTIASLFNRVGDVDDSRFGFSSEDADATVASADFNLCKGFGERYAVMENYSGCIGHKRSAQFSKSTQRSVTPSAELHFEVDAFRCLTSEVAVRQILRGISLH